ncbi:MAG TPA: energy-coupling factor transporter transmembrane component T [Solirubrobacterales bacterium]|nr:energy-coupling factor transporter transmembrane component T [Solirubrobacterales bacterium]
MKKLSPIAFVPRRESMQSASPGPVALYLGAYLVLCFFSSDPVVLLAATIGAAIAGYGCGAGRAVNFSLKLGAFLALTMVIVNALVTSRGATVLARLGDWPVLGRVDVTAEAIAAGGVIGLRALGTMVVIGVWSACVDPDRILQAVHGVARRSALTATLISRLVPLAATDYARIGEAAALRGPGATPVGRAAMAHRLLAGSLDRAVDVAATLELRGYGQNPGPVRFRKVPSRYNRRFWLAGTLLSAFAAFELLLGSGRFETYPEIGYSIGYEAPLLAAALVGGGFTTWRGRGK